MLVRSSFARLLPKGCKKRRQFLFISARALLAWLCQERYRAVAHAARGAKSRDDGGDDAADDLEDGLPRFFLHVDSVFKG